MRVRDALETRKTLSDFKKMGEKGENGMSDLKKNGKMTCKVAENDRTPEQRDD